MHSAPNRILVKISEEIRRAVFEKPIKSVTGEEFFVITKLRADADEDKFFAQGVSIGECVSVGAGVNNVQVGDTVIMDYIVDVNPEYTVQKEKDYKIVTVTTKTTYKEADLILPPNRRKPRPTIVHKKGELNEGALLLAVVRDNIITPNFPYLFMDYKEENIDEFYEQFGTTVWSRSTTTPVVERKVLLAYPGSDIKPEDTILIEADALFSRSLDDAKFDVAYDHDVICIESE